MMSDPTQSAPPGTPPPPAPTCSGSRFAEFYFALQAILCAAWWAGLAGSSRFFELFLPAGSPRRDLIAFAPPDILLVLSGSALAAVAIRRGWSITIPVAWWVAGGMSYAALYCLAWAALADSGWWSVAAMMPAAFLSLLAASDLSVDKLSAFRRARPAHRRRHLAATALQTVLFWSFFLAVVPTALVFLEGRLGLPRFSFPGQVPLAILLFLACGSLGLRSGYVMASRGEGTPFPLDATNRLLTSGPYAVVRNPMVMAGLGQGLAVGLGLGSWLTLAYVALGGFLWNIIVRPTEERDLLATFGGEFEAYRRRVRCWVPRRASPREDHSSGRSPDAESS